MVNCMCEVGCVWCLDMELIIILDVSMRLVFNDINILPSPIS